MIQDDDKWDGDMGMMGHEIPDWLEYCERKENERREDELGRIIEELGERE